MRVESSAQIRMQNDLRAAVFQSGQNTGWKPMLLYCINNGLPQCSMLLSRAILALSRRVAAGVETLG
jgi:hypothetical protein